MGSSNPTPISPGSNVATIAGGAAGGGAGLLIIVAIVVCIRRRNRTATHQPPPQASPAPGILAKPAATVYGVPAAGAAPRPPQEPSKRGRIPDIDMSDAGGGYSRGATYVPPRGNAEAVPEAFQKQAQQQQRPPAPYSYTHASNEDAPAAAAAAPTTLVAWLSRNGLPPSLAAVLRSTGVNTVADLQYVTDADVAALGVPVITRRRLFASVVQQLGGGSS